MDKKASLSNWKLVFGLAAAGCGSFICLLGLLAALNASKIMVFIQPDERAVVVTPYEDSGLRKDTLAPGFHLLRPFEEAVVYNIARQTYTLTSKQIFTETKNLSFDNALPVRTHDGLMFSLGLTTVYAIDPDKIIDLYITWQQRYQEEFVWPQIRKIARDNIVKYNAADLTTKHAEIESTIRHQVETILGKNDLVLLNLHILYIEPAP